MFNFSALVNNELRYPISYQAYIDGKLELMNDFGIEDKSGDICAYMKTECHSIAEIDRYCKKLIDDFLDDYEKTEHKSEIERKRRIALKKSRRIG